MGASIEPVREAKKSLKFLVAHQIIDMIRKVLSIIYSSSPTMDRIDERDFIKHLSPVSAVQKKLNMY